MEISKTVSQVMPSPMVYRIRELLEQSKRYQTELARITDEIQQLQARLAALSTEEDRESVA